MASALQGVLIDFLQPLLDTANDSDALVDWLSMLGLTETVSGSPALRSILQNAAAIAQQLQALDPSTLDSWSGVQQVLTLGRQLSGILQELQQFAASPSLAQAAEGLGEDILSLLLASYLRRKQPTAFRVAALLTLIQAREYAVPRPAIVDSNDVVLRYPRVIDTFNFSEIGNLVTKPGQTLAAAYFPNNLATGIDAYNGAQQFFNALSFLMLELGVGSNKLYPPSSPAPPDGTSADSPIDATGDNSDIATGESSVTITVDTTDAGPDDTTGDGSDTNSDDTTDDVADFLHSDFSWGSSTDSLPVSPPLAPGYYAGFFPTLHINILGSQNSVGNAAIDVIASSAQHPGGVAGYLLTPSGTFNDVITLGDWRLTLSGSGAIPAFVVKAGGIDLAPSGLPVEGGTAKVLLELVPASGSTGPALVVGSATGTRLELGSVSFEGDLFFDPSRKAASVSAKAAKGSFVISGGDGDGFIASVLPRDGMKAAFEAGVEWASDKGLSFTGGAGLDATLPIGVAIGGVITIPSIRLTLLAGASVQLQLSASVGVAIGPIQATVSGLGVAANLTFPSGGGNLGPADLDFSFKPPTGVGLAINSAGVSGGGFLSFDSPKHQYTGVLQLQFNDLALQAFGIITTQVAGSDGYSLLALIDANFPPVELGLGFTLNGVGGLLAIHRTASEDALRAAMKAGTLSNILFPKNAITNAAQILAELDSLFPTAPGRFLFGPMALIGWGTPTVLTASIAVILELPAPIEIILLGVLQARFPTPDAPLVKINMDAVGVIDFSQDELSLDATLFDSKLISFTIAGDMALRVNWGSNSEFLLSIGGFHPQFTPPSGFPALKRITIDMPSGIVSKLRLAAYLAVTSNSLQFGAALDVFIGVSGFGLSGHLGFDALLQLSPFHFEADISGSIALTAGGDDLMSVSLDASLTGPAPWNIAGKFKVHIVFFDVHISFSQTWGAGAPSEQVSKVDVGALLNTTLADPRSWNVQLPTGLAALVSTRKVEDSTAVFAHPLALVGVHERLVPLDLVITHFGQATPSGATQFSITRFQLGTTVLNYDAIQDQFAPAQFFDLNDSDKLSRPSYELHDAGVVMKGTLVKNGNAVPKTTDYETYFIDTPGALRVDEGVPQPFPWGNIIVILQTGAAAQKAISRAGNRRYTAPGNPIQVAEPAFALVDTASLTPQAATPAGKTTYSDVHAQLAGALAASPAKRDGLQIVATHEMAAA